MQQAQTAAQLRGSDKLGLCTTQSSELQPPTHNALQPGSRCCWELPLVHGLQTYNGRLIKCSHHAPLQSVPSASAPVTNKFQGGPRSSTCLGWQSFSNVRGCQGAAWLETHAPAESNVERRGALYEELTSLCSCSMSACTALLVASSRAMCTNMVGG